MKSSTVACSRRSSKYILLPSFRQHLLSRVVSFFRSGALCCSSWLAGWLGGWVVARAQNYRDVLLQDDTLSKKIERADITAIFAGIVALPLRARVCAHLD
jgi:hypothetical protein